VKLEPLQPMAVRPIPCAIWSGLRAGNVHEHAGMCLGSEQGRGKSRTPVQASVGYCCREQHDPGGGRCWCRRTVDRDCGTRRRACIVQYGAWPGAGAFQVERPRFAPQCRRSALGGLVVTPALLVMCCSVSADP
jgi:hypothetical protein